MPRTKDDHPTRRVRKLRMVARCNVVTLPPDFIRRLGLHKADTIVLTLNAEKNEIILTKPVEVNHDATDTEVFA